MKRRLPIRALLLPFAIVAGCGNNTGSDDPQGESGGRSASGGGTGGEPQNTTGGGAPGSGAPTGGADGSSAGGNESGGSSGLGGSPQGTDGGTGGTTGGASNGGDPTTGGAFPVDPVASCAGSIGGDPPLLSSCGEWRGPNARQRAETECEAAGQNAGDTFDYTLADAPCPTEGATAICEAVPDDGTTPAKALLYYDALSFLEQAQAQCEQAGNTWTEY